MSGTLGAALAVLFLLAGTPAFAHLAIEGVGGFWGGLLHPALVPAHALGIAALGLFIGRQQAPKMIVLIFAMALGAGLLAVTLAVAASPAGNVLLADTALLGIVVATAWAPPRLIGWVLAAIAGSAIGLDSPPQTISIDEGNRLLVGTGLGGCLALAAVAAGACAVPPGWPQLGLRILGSWIAASAILVLAISLGR
jgi:urease accessory protein